MVYLCLQLCSSEFDSHAQHAFCICKIEGNKQKEAEIGPYFFKKSTRSDLRPKTSFNCDGEFADLLAECHTLLISQFYTNKLNKYNFTISHHFLVLNQHHGSRESKLSHNFGAVPIARMTYFLTV